jgi:hypothetical protein
VTASVSISLALSLTFINQGLEIDSACEFVRRRLGLEQARRLSEYNEAPVPGVRPRFDEAAQISQLEKVLHVAFPSREPSQTLSETGLRGENRDFASAIDLVREAADFMRSTDDRARESEMRMQEIVQRATEELKASEARVQAADARTRTAEARAADAERRLKEAEEWLARIHDVIAEELPSRAAPR